MIKGIIFDMDGVLVDNRDVHIEAFVIFGKRYGVDINRERLLEVFGMSNDEILPELLPHQLIEDNKIETLADEKEHIYREIFADTIAPTPGLVDFIEEVKSKGVKRAVGSSGNTQNVNFVLEKCNIADKFDAVVNGDMVDRAKPDPTIFLKAAERMGLKPENCLVIEDAFAGIEAANRAGMKVIGMATTHTRKELSEAKTNLIVNDFRDLSYDIISKL